LARCKLEIDNPKFLDSIGGDQADKSLLQGLKELQAKLAKDHRLSTFVNHPMKGHPDLQNRIWKWDFAPEGDTSSTRKGWRIFAYVENPKAEEPIPATPFYFYEKPGPSGNPVPHIAEALKRFLRRTIQVRADDRFKRQYDGDKIISICYECFDTTISTDMQEIEIHESTHECS